MKTRSSLVGLAAGFSLGYAAYRTFEAARELRRPRTPAHKDARAYGAARRAAMLAGIARSLAGTAALAYGPAGARIERLTRPPQQWLRPVTFAVALQLLDAAIELPAAFVEGYALERRYALTAQAPAQWLAERVKETALSAAVAGVLAGLLGWLVRRYPSRWPWLASAGTFPLLVLANVAVPLYVLPLFNTFEPLRGPLEERLRVLAARYGCGSAEILRVDMSRQTTKANAYVIGIGGTHRIVVGDTLLDHFTDDEIAFVVAHELGHYASKDSWRAIGLAQATTTALLLAAERAAGRDVRDAPQDPRSLLRIAFWMTLFAQLVRPAIAAFSRQREWAADRFALAATAAPRSGADAFTRLRERNLAEDEAPRWFELLFASHPPLKARIAALERAAR